MVGRPKQVPITLNLDWSKVLVIFVFATKGGV